MKLGDITLASLNIYTSDSVEGLIIKHDFYWDGDDGPHLRIAFGKTKEEAEELLTNLLGGDK